VARHDRQSFLQMRRAENGDVIWKAEGERAASGIMDAPTFRAYWKRVDLGEIGMYSAFSSSNLTALGYDPIAWQLVVEFQGHGRYLYDNVPPHLAEPLVEAAQGRNPGFSLGEYLARAIKTEPDRYPYTKLDARIPV
jgi:hypothetical protein